MAKCSFAKSYNPGGFMTHTRAGVPSTLGVRDRVVQTLFLFGVRRAAGADCGV